VLRRTDQSVSQSITTRRVASIPSAGWLELVCSLDDGGVVRAILLFISDRKKSAAGEISKVDGKSHGAYCNMYINLLRCMYVLFISTL
jgi:hypothetical protein